MTTKINSVELATSIRNAEFRGDVIGASEARRTLDNLSGTWVWSDAAGKYVWTLPAPCERELNRSLLSYA
jgi:hypothetical protein